MAIATAQNHFDTLVIGGGAAGLAAAATLGRAGQKVALLEARARLGGRVFSCTDPGLHVPLELGAEFIHGKAAATSAFLQAAGVVPVDAEGAHFVRRDGGWQRSESIFSEAGQLLGPLDTRGEDLSFAALLEQPTSQQVDAQTKMYARMLVEGFDAADPEDASSLALAEEWQGSTAAEDAQFRPLGSYHGLLHSLTRSLAPNVEVLLGTVVQDVAWNVAGGGVSVSSRRFGESLTLTAERAVVTLPLSLLKAESVRFTPDLGKKAAIDGLAMGGVVKLVLSFPYSFWEDVEGGQLRHAAFFHDPEAPFPTLWTPLPLRLPVLTAWAGGPKAAALAEHGKAELVQQVLASLTRLFGQHPRPENVYFHDWQADPFSLGAYSYVKVGSVGARAKLAEPISNVLFFAGEATNTEGEAGTVYGALQSGARAAEEVLGA